MKKRTLSDKDGLIKSALEQLFPYMLRYVLKDADDIFDLSAPIIFLDKEMATLFPNRKKKGLRILDKLAMVKLRNLNEYGLVNAEAEGSGRTQFLSRFFSYYYRVRDKHGGKICSIAILTDRNKEFHPVNFSEDFAGTKVDFHFNSLKLWGKSKEELEKDENPFTPMMLTVLAALEKGRIPDIKIIELAKRIAINIINRKIDGPIKDALIIFLYYFIDFENQEMMRKFEKEISFIIHKDKEMVTISYRQQLLDDALSHKQEWMEEAAKAKSLVIAGNFLKEGVPAPIVSKNTGLTLAEVHKLAKQLMTTT